jgi:ectoine hydroxylase-related dioxygenase (phytanoyl-CoA dioxygenase family)
MLTSEQTRQYHDEGYVLLTNIFDDADLAGWRREADRLEAIVAPPAPDKPRLQVEPEPDGGKTKLRMIEPLVDLSPVYRELSEDPRVLECVESIYEEPAFLFEDKINYKPARVGSGFPLHQDYSYWQEFSEKILSVFIHIDDAPLATGCMKLIPGTHRMGLLPVKEDGHCIRTNAVDWDQMRTFESQAGDVLIFHCMTAHESDPNYSNSDRRAFVLSYNPQSDGNQYRYDDERLASYH